MSTEKGQRIGVTIGELIELMAPTLGVQKSAALITETAARLGYAQVDPLTRTQSLAILRTLGASEGIIGVVARFAVSRVSTTWMPRVEPLVPPRPWRSSPNAPTVSLIPASELEALLATSVGADKAHELFASTAARLGLGGGPYSRDEALALMDGMADQDGLVGIVARFARARVLLKLK